MYSTTHHVHITTSMHAFTITPGRSSLFAPFSLDDVGVREVGWSLGGCTPPPPPPYNLFQKTIFGNKASNIRAKPLDFRASAGEGTSAPHHPTVTGSVGYPYGGQWMQHYTTNDQIHCTAVMQTSTHKEIVLQ